jgi:hypothetical protein
MNKGQVNREGGFSLVQVMVAIGLSAGLAVTMMKMTDNQIKQQKTMELKAEQGDVATIIRQTLSDKEACDATFKGMSPGDQIEAIRMSSDMSQTPFALIGVKFKTFNVYIKEMALLTRAEEITFKQRAATANPIASYITGSGFGYLRVVFVKNVGVVSDTNQTHNFYGAKETATIFPIKGFFYDVEVVKHNVEEKLQDSCWAKAAMQGVSCNGTTGERCSTVPIDVDGTVGTDFITDAGTKLFLAECRYFRDDSPFMSCSI